MSDSDGFKSAGRLDRKNSVIHDVSLIRTGPAKGHNMEADGITLAQIMKLWPSSGLKAKINHRDTSGVLSVNGRYLKPHITQEHDGAHIRADWHLVPSHPATPQIFALAEHQPQDVGVSLTLGTTKEPSKSGNKMRVNCLKSADLVDDPACNSTFLEISELEARTEPEYLVEPEAYAYFLSAKERNISLVEIERTRRLEVIEAGESGSKCWGDKQIAAHLEELSARDPDFKGPTGLDSLAYQRATGYFWRFTRQNFDVPVKTFLERSHSIVVGYAAGASPAEQEAAFTALSARSPEILTELSKQE